MVIEKVLDYISRIAPSIAYWKIILCSLLMIFLFEGVVWFLNRGRTERIKPFRIMVYGLIFYSNFILRLTLLGRDFGGERVDAIRLYVSINEILSTHGILNMILFVPFGFFLYAILRHYEIPIKVLLTVLISLMFTILIEMIQLATQSGRFEIDDIVTNTLGGLLGCFPSYLIFDLLFHSEDDI